MATIRNNTTAHRYEMEVEGVTAFVAYHRVGAAVSLDHTEVPGALGGKGVGSALARGTFLWSKAAEALSTRPAKGVTFAGLDLVRSEGLKIIPKCPFISGFITRHSEYQDLVAKN